jgi:hypothetical protein
MLSKNANFFIVVVWINHNKVQGGRKSDVKVLNVFTSNFMW